MLNEAWDKNRDKKLRVGLFVPFLSAVGQKLNLSWVGSVCRPFFLSARNVVNWSVPLNILHHCQGSTVFLPLAITVCSYKKLAISEHKTVNLPLTLLDAQSYNLPLNRQFLVGAVSGCPSFFCVVSLRIGLSCVRWLALSFAFALPSKK